MPLNSHFFIESVPDTGLGQDAATSFGPISDTTFNITSKINLSGTKKAFSICRGIVLVQPQLTSTSSTPATKVNLILRPFKQPFPGLNVKYFIYRGLKIDSFFNGNEVLQPSSSTSDFINKIRGNFSDYYTSMGINPAPVFLAKHIGYDEATPLNTLISEFFFKESVFVENTPNGGVFTEPDNLAFELPLIDGGQWIGNFDQTGPCGIDVVLNNGDYKHNFESQEFTFDLNYARSSFAKIELNSGDSDLQKKLKREQSTQFMDIAAFYGLFVKEDTVSVSDNTGTTSTKIGAAIYNELINRFFNKNKWYVYLQGDRSRSYNFYGTYKIASTNANSLKMGVVNTSLNEAEYKTNGWPMLVVETVQLANPEGRNKLFLQFVTDNNVNTVLYGQLGTVENAQNNFANADVLRQEPDGNGVYSNLTQIIELSQPRLAPNDGTILAGISLLLYHGVAYRYQSGTTLDETSTEIPVYSIPNFFDDVFGLINSSPLMQLNADTQFSKMVETRVQLINHYFDRKQQGISAVQTLTINDIIDTGVEGQDPVARVTYVTEAVNVSANPVSPTGSVATDTKTSASAGGTVGKSKTYVLPEPYHYTLQLFTDSTQTITGLKLTTTNGAIPSKIILGITKDENDLLKAIISVQNIINPRLFLMDLFEDGSDLISPENIKYQKYKVGVVGEDTTGSLKLFYPTTDVMVYSLDRLYHFSKGYSEHVKEEAKNALILDLDISL